MIIAILFIDHAAKLRKYHIIMMSVMLAFYLLVIIMVWYYQQNIGPIKH